MSTSSKSNRAQDASAADGAVYALQVVVFTEDFEGSTSYVSLANDLDLGNFSLKDAREFPGFVAIAAVDDQLIVGDSEQPVLTRYEIGPNLAWNEADKLSFGSRGVDDANFFSQFPLDASTVYAAYDLTKRVIWNPTTFRITGVAEDSQLELARDGLALRAESNRSASDYFQHRGPVMRPFFYVDQDLFRYAPSSQIAVYDRTSHAEQAIVDLPCPGLSTESQDEAGRTYFSTWIYNPTLALFGEGPAPCVARLRADATLDEDWKPDLKAWAGGRHLKVFRYLQDGKALVSVLHDEELNADFSKFSPEATKGVQLAGHWRLWLFDLEAQSARPIEGMEPIDPSFHYARHGDRTFVFAPYDGFGRTKVYEIDLNGTATERLDTAGWVYSWTRVR